MAESKKLLKWRSKQKPGAIMSPATFRKIEASATKSYGSKESGQRVAGAAYWKTAESKFRSSKGRKR